MADADVVIGGARAAKLNSEIAKMHERLEEEIRHSRQLAESLRKLSMLRDDIGKMVPVVKTNCQAVQAAIAAERRASPATPRAHAVAAPRPAAAAGDTEKAALRIFNDLNSEEPFKSMFVTADMTVTDLIRLTLRKFRIDDDPEQYVIIEVDGTEEHILEEPPLVAKKRSDAKGYEMKLFLSKRVKDGALRVYNGSDPTEHFKSIMVSSNTTTEEVIVLAHRKFGASGDPSAYRLHLMNGNVDRALGPNEFPLAIVSKWVRRGEGDKVKVVLRAGANNILSGAATAAAARPASAIVSPQEVRQQLKGAPENDYCADCDAPGPDQVSINYGLFLCGQCAAIHTSLNGSKIAGDSGRVFCSKIRPAQHFTWTAGLFDLVKRSGNGAGNKFWEKRLINSGFEKPSPASSNEEKTAFIVEKYLNGHFAEDVPSLLKPGRHPHELLYQVTLAGDAVRVMQLLGWGVDPNLPHPDPRAQGRTALHIAAARGDYTIVELLIAAGANPCMEDRTNHTAFYYAQANHHTELATLLRDYQMLFQASIRNDRASSATAKISNKLASLPDDDFRNNMLADVLLESERRHALSNPRGGTPPVLPANRPGLARLSALDADNFAKLAETVFDELHAREMCATFKKSNPPREPSDWVDSFRAFQDRESALAARANQKELSDIINVEIPSCLKTAATPAAAPAAKPPSVAAPPASPAKTASVAATPATPAKTASGSRPVSTAAAAAAADTAGAGTPISAAERLRQEQLRLEEQRRREQAKLEAEIRAFEEQQRAEREAVQRAIEEEKRRLEEEARLREEQRRRLEEYEREERERAERELQELEALAAAEAADLARREEEAALQRAAAEATMQAELAQKRAREEAERKRKEEERARREAEMLAAKRAQEAEEERRRQEAELQAQAEMRRMAEEHAKWVAQMEEEERLERERRAAEAEAEMKASLANLITSAQEAEAQRRAQAEREEAERRAHMQAKKEALAERYGQQAKVQLEPVVQAVKGLLAAAQQGQPSAYVASTAAVAQAAHALVTFADEAALDPNFDPFKRSDIEKGAATLMQAIKDMVEAAKTAARLHPQPEALEVLKAGAMSLVRSTKELVTCVATP